MSLARQVTALIERYGHEISLCSGGEERTGKAMLQFVKGTGEQFTYSPLGEENRQKILYLGQASLGISASGDRVLWGEKKYQVLSAHPVYCGTDLAYWRGILTEVALDCSYGAIERGEGFEF